MSKNKWALLRLSVGAVCLAAGFLQSGTVSLFLCLAAWLIAGYDVLWEAIAGIFHGQLLDENFLMAVATVGAFFLGEYPEGAAVMLFYQLGEVFQRYAVGKTRRSVTALAELQSDVAHGESGDISPEEVRVGERISVYPGERIPLDGVVESGQSALDTSALTGESLPREVTVGDALSAGCVNLSGVLTLRVTGTASDSAVSRILRLTEEAAERKAESEKFITRFARIYTPAVVIGAVLLCTLPLLFGGHFTVWLRRSLMLLMISCPCALVLSVPLCFFAGIGAAARRGILVKGSNVTEALARIDTVVLDKTGTLTEGRFRVERLLPRAPFTEEELLRLSASAEAFSSHPLAAAIKKEADARGLAVLSASDVTEQAGFGVTAQVEGHRLQVGGERLASSLGQSLSPTAVCLLCDGVFAGEILLRDAPKAEAAEALAALKKQGVRTTVLLTGDSEAAARQVAADTGVDVFYASLLPEDKVKKLEALPSLGRGVMFVGDGINDAPALARADVGVAMGALGSDAAIEAADVVLAEDNLSRIAEGIRLSRRTLRLVKQNIVFSLAVKAVILLCALFFPHLNLLAAVLADVGVMVLAVLNSLRALK